MSAPVDVLARIETVWGRDSAEYAAVAELIAAAREVEMELPHLPKRLAAALASVGAA